METIQVNGVNINYTLLGRIIERRQQITDKQIKIKLFRNYLKADIKRQPKITEI